MAKLEGFDRIIRMDLSKRTFKACVLTRGKNFEDRKIFSGSMTPEVRGHLLSQIGKKDVVSIEGGTSSNNFARELEAVAGKNHSEIRRILKKGTDIDFDQPTCDRMMDNINSYFRPQFQNKSAYDMFLFFYGEDAARALGISRIPAKDINLTPSCLKPTES